MNIHYSSQRGAVLLISLIILLILTLIGVSSTKSTTMEEKIVSNLQESQKAFYAAESAAQYAWSEANGYDLDEFIDNQAYPGYYDLRIVDSSSKISGGKYISNWDAITNVVDWPWSDANKQQSMPNSVSSTNNMELAIKPQYIVGMRDPVLRAGSEYIKCMPFAIVGAGSGSNENSKALIQLEVIPPTLCYSTLVK